jgi:hypothetical protein
MRACLLRAGLTKARGISNWVLGNPKAWLGTAYHEVLEKIAQAELEQETLEAAVDRLWNQAITALQRRVDGHTLNRRYGEATRWPGYHVARASVMLRAGELIGERGPALERISKQASSTVSPATLREQEFTAFGGRLRGRPDVIRAQQVLDYKSGAVLEHDPAAHADVVKLVYVRQLRIYGYLVKQNLGWWPRRGVLLPLGGAQVEVELDPAECERDANEAIALLEAYDARLRAGTVTGGFASPSPEACRWCPYKLICPPFWQASTPEWSGQLDGAALEGVLAEDPMVSHAGAAMAIAIDVEAGSENLRRVQVAPLNSDTHASVTSLLAGERVRLVGLRTRPDGVLAPTARTVVARVDDLPVIVVPTCERT